MAKHIPKWIATNCTFWRSALVTIYWSITQNCLLLLIKKSAIAQYSVFSCKITHNWFYFIFLQGSIGCDSLDSIFLLIGFPKCLLASSMHCNRWKLMKQLPNRSWEIRFTSTLLSSLPSSSHFSVSSLTKISENLHPFACRIMIASLRNEWASILVLSLCSHHFWQSASCFDCINISCTDNTFKCPFCHFSFVIPRTIVCFSSN